MTLDDANRILSDPALNGSVQRNRDGTVSVEVIGGRPCVYVEGYLTSEELLAYVAVLLESDIYITQQSPQ